MLQNSIKIFAGLYYHSINLLWYYVVLERHKSNRNNDIAHFKNYFKMLKTCDGITIIIKKQNMSQDSKK